MSDPVVATLTLTTNGLPGELEYAWDAPAQELTLQGFRVAGSPFTLVAIEFALLSAPEVFYQATVSVTSDMDIHDIRAAVIAELTSALASADPDSTVELVEETLATVVVDFWIDFTYYPEEGDEDPPVFGGDASDGPDGGDGWGGSNGGSGGAIGLNSLVFIGVLSGICAARGRLVAWDRDNAVYRSGFLDIFNFTPSLETQASVGKVQAVAGNIVTMRPHAEGFYIFSTSNIVRADYTTDTYVFRYTVLPGGAGVADPRHVSNYGDKVAFLTAEGIYMLETEGDNAAPSQVAPALSTALQRWKWPLTIRLLNNRYLMFSFHQFPYDAQMLAARRDVIKAPIQYAAPVPTATTLATVPIYAERYVESVRTLLFDMHLEKWGSFDDPHKILFSLQPINAGGADIVKAPFVDDLLDYHTQGRSLGIAYQDGTVALANWKPSASALVLGYLKTQSIGESRLLEVYAEQRIPGLLSCTVECYNSAKSQQSTSTVQFTTNTLAQAIPLDLSANYFICVVEGNYDLTQLMFSVRANGKL